jgi:hypothetical protein
MERIEKIASIESGGGPPHSKMLARGPERMTVAKRLGVRQSSGAFNSVFAFDTTAVTWLNSRLRLP